MRENELLEQGYLKREGKRIVMYEHPEEDVQYLLMEPVPFLFTEGRFYLEDENKKMIAEVTYVKNNNILILNHTFVDPVLRGRGMAAKLVDRVVALALDTKKKILPICPYAIDVFNTYPAYDLVRAK